MRSQLQQILTTGTGCCFLGGHYKQRRLWKWEILHLTSMPCVTDATPEWVGLFSASICFAVALKSSLFPIIFFLEIANLLVYFYAQFPRSHCGCLHVYALSGLIPNGKAENLQTLINPNETLPVYHDRRDAGRAGARASSPARAARPKFLRGAFLFSSRAR